VIIDSTPLDFEVRRVLDSNFSPNLYGYTGQFKIGDKVIDVLRITDLDEESDYEMNYGAVMTCRVVMPLGDYTTQIFPAKGNLEFILKTENVNYKTLEPSDQEGSIIVRVYNVSLHPEARPFMSEDNNMENSSREVQNLMSLVEVDLQLKPKLLDDISKVTVGGNFLETSNADLLRNLLKFYCNDMELDDDQKLIGVNLHSTASEKVHDTVVVDHGTNLCDLADYLQVKAGGVFPAGMAQFVHNRVWYLYPPYDTSGFDEAQRKIVIISVPAKRYPQVEKTFLEENGIVTILATGNKKIISDKNQIQDNAGNGVMFADANQMVSGFSTVKGNTAVAKRGQNNSEFVGESAKTGKNNVKMAPEGITSNPFVSTSRLARSQGHFFMVEWENADPELIEPGINVKIMYLNEGEVKSITGVLVKCHRQTKMNGQGMLATGYRTFCVLVVFVRADESEDSGLLGLE
jgi:hypothetical protein